MNWVCGCGIIIGLHARRRVYKRAYVFQLSKIDIDLGAVVTITDFLVLAVTWTNALVVANGK